MSKVLYIIIKPACANLINIMKLNEYNENIGGHHYIFTSRSILVPIRCCRLHVLVLVVTAESLYATVNSDSQGGSTYCGCG